MGAERPDQLVAAPRPVAGRLCGLAGRERFSVVSRLHGAAGIWGLVVFLIVELWRGVSRLPGEVRALVDPVLPARDLRGAANALQSGARAGAKPLGIDEAVALAREPFRAPRAASRFPAGQAGSALSRGALPSGQRPARPGYYGICRSLVASGHRGARPASIHHRRNLGMAAQHACRTRARPGVETAGVPLRASAAAFCADRRRDVAAEAWPAKIAERRA